MDVQDAIDDFIMVHEIDNGSKYTIRDYRKVTGRFAAWLKAEHGITDTDAIALAHLRGWVSYLQKTPLKPDGSVLGDSTVYNYSLVTQVFCHWLEVEGAIDPPITTRFKLPRLTEKFIPTFTHDDVEKLLEACEEGERDKPRLRKALTARNRAIVSVLIDTGIRRQELVGLRLCDVDRRMMVLTVRRKGANGSKCPSRARASRRCMNT
jgi:site-specific recombinase XerD